jgi:hypothetical protein
MSDPFDLDSQPPDPHGRGPGGAPAGVPRPPVPGRPPQAGQLPTSRASDLLTAKPKGTGGTSGDPNGPGPAIDRRATPFDDTAGGLFTLSALIFIAGLAYLLFGTWGGSFTVPNWNHSLHHDDRLRIIGNISLCGEVMWGALVVATLAFLFLYYHEDFAGYSLLVLALILNVGLPYATAYIFSAREFAPSDATNTISAVLSSQAWLVGVPGLTLTVFNIGKSLIEGLSAARSRRSLLKFGQAAVKDIKPRNQFLGACWNLPYCKDGVRSKCPIFIQKRGPCWQNKRGCMCDQTILLIAQAPNWKQSVNSTVGKLEGKTGALSMPELPPQPQLSKEAKNERCRQCVIYNLHQEQKYKLVVGLVFAVVVAFIVVFNAQMLDFTGRIFMEANDLIGHLSITSDTSPLFPNGAPEFVVWLMLGSVMLVVISKLLQLVEYCCFKLKI